VKGASVVCLVTAVLLAGGVRAAAPITVTQKGLQFSVEDLNVSKGQVVVFVNDDRTAHNITVTGEGVSLNGGLQQPGAEFKEHFAKAGTYQDSCGIHTKMKLNVTMTYERYASWIHYELFTLFADGPLGDRDSRYVSVGDRCRPDPAALARLWPARAVAPPASRVGHTPAGCRSPGPDQAPTGLEKLLHRPAA